MLPGAWLSVVWLVWQPPPQPPPDVILGCFAFSQTGPACADCWDVNNCGNCSNGICDAEVAAVCVRGYVATPVRPPASRGRTMKRVEVPCSYTLECIRPDPCVGACRVGAVPLSFSENTTWVPVALDECVLAH
jgi:hypothetical protein